MRTFTGHWIPDTNKPTEERPTFKQTEEKAKSLLRAVETGQCDPEEAHREIIRQAKISKD